MTFVDKFVSITDIRKNATGYINNINKDGEKIIFVNNKPKAVLISIQMYEKLISQNNIEMEFEGLEGSEEILGTKEYKNLISLLKNA